MGVIMHIPICETNELEEVLTFEQALSCEQNTEPDYDREAWLYVPPFYSEYRYILGTRGENPLICIGVNPSTAKPGALDNTLKSVERAAHFNGYDSFIMFNVYAQRATNPEDMDKAFNDFLHEENMKAFRHILSLYKEGSRPAVWAAWGTVIEKRPYLIECVRDMVRTGEEYGARWFTIGKRSVKGHPHHPLYLPNGVKTEEFDALAYLDSIS